MFLTRMRNTDDTIGDVGTKEIAEALKKNSVLRHLNLFGEKLNIVKLKHKQSCFDEKQKTKLEKRVRDC